jgi:polyisoprenoid-binding protein YceI
LFSTSKPLLLAGLLGLAVSAPAWAAPRSFTIQPDSVIRYSGHHPAHEWTGVSHFLRGTFRLDPDAPALDTPVTVAVPVRSFDSGNRNRDSNALATLDASRFPQVSLRIDRVTGFRRDGNKGSATVEGTLTFHGVAKPVSFPINGQLDGNRLSATAAFPVSITAHGIQTPKLLFVPMNDVIDVTVQLNAKAD